MIAPVAAAFLAAVAAATAFGVDSYAIHVSITQSPTIPDYALYAGLGGVCAAFAIVLMLLVARGEQLAKGLLIPAPVRLMLGGAALAGLALLSPQTLSSGHGALHHDLFFKVTLTALATILVLKTLASVISLSTGFRGVL